MNLLVRETTETDRAAALHVERQAFGHDDEAKLVDGLLGDPTAAPCLSLLALTDDQPVGHVLFTKVTLAGSPAPVSAAILAPLAVVPEAQRQGIGTRLVREGLERLTDAGVELVFVLGDPGYYGRHGFKPAGARGFEAPYPIPAEHADAWMVQELQPGVMGRVSGKVVCAETLNRPEHWRE